MTCPILQVLFSARCNNWLTNVSSIPFRYRYDVALIYLKQADYDLDLAIEAYKADEKWEKEHPLDQASSSKSKSRAQQSQGRRRFGIGGGITGQLS